MMNNQLLVQCAAVAVVSFLSGLYLGQAFYTQKPIESRSDHDSDEEELDELPEGKVDASKFRDFKMVLVVRTDLGMTKGKVAAQCGHATLACYKAASKTNPDVLRAWERSGQAKVALKIDSEEKLLELQAIALSMNLTAQSICDAGRTQIAAGSRTVLGIGPGPVELINSVTGHLKLL
ncbi:peptidyl-tRNA hydrolase PTH2-domain-containing protein [Fennellomyces sp. T-0311]|nr:peptidyl-tRNA hydrolase PTH2-domain-containing protein [Fennellomyces sp. T-0311]